MIRSSRDKVHSSPSDSRPHSTVDAFDSDDKPIGCVHVYPNNEVQAFVKARSLALEVSIFPAWVTECDSPQNRPTNARGMQPRNEGCIYGYSIFAKSGVMQ